MQCGVERACTTKYSWNSLHCPGRSAARRGGWSFTVRIRIRLWALCTASYHSYFQGYTATQSPVVSVDHALKDRNEPERHSCRPFCGWRRRFCALVVWAYAGMTVLAIADDQPPQGRVESHIVRLPFVDANDIRFNRLSTAQGLSQTKVLQIVEDNQGFTWFGTQYGLNRYDGYNFRTFVNDPNEPNSLSGRVVSSLFKDRAGALWIGCSEFLNRFDL